MYNISDKTPEERIAAIEMRLEQLDDRHDAMERRFANDLKSHKLQTHAHIDSVRASVGAVHATVDEVTLGGLHVQMFGLFLLVYSAVAGYLG